MRCFSREIHLNVQFKSSIFLKGIKGFVLLSLYLMASCSEKKEVPKLEMKSPKETIEINHEARVAKADGVVKFQNSETGQWKQVKTKDSLNKGDVLKTLRDSKVKVNLAKNGRFELLNQSELYFLGNENGFVNLGLRDGFIKVAYSFKGGGANNIQIKTPLGWIQPYDQPGVYEVDVAIEGRFFNVFATKGNFSINWEGQKQSLQEGKLFRKKIRRQKELSNNFSKIPKPLPFVKDVKEFKIIEPPENTKTHDAYIIVVADVMDDQSVYFKGEKLEVKNNTLKVNAELTIGPNVLVFDTVIGRINKQYKFEIYRGQ